MIKEKATKVRVCGMEYNDGKVGVNVMTYQCAGGGGRQRESTTKRTERYRIDRIVKDLSNERGPQNSGRFQGAKRALQDIRGRRKQVDEFANSVCKRRHVIERMSFSS